MDRKLFFDRVRVDPFRQSLSQAQVDGVTALLDTWQQLGDGDARKLAYVLATAFHETARTMQPIREFGRGAGHPYGEVDQTGKAPYGRGYVQLTHRENYVNAAQKLGIPTLAIDYDMALRPDIAAKIIVEGMAEGWFTGKRLKDYISASGCDYVGARRIVNGTDRADLIAGYAKAFEAALTLAGRVPDATPPAAPAPPIAAAPTVDPVHAPAPTPAAPSLPPLVQAVPAPPVAPKAPVARTAAVGVGIAAVLALGGHFAAGVMDWFHSLYMHFFGG